MKKFLLTALVAVSIMSSAFAKNENWVSNKVANAFATDFNSVSNVNWTMMPQLAKASFILKGKSMEAFYNFSGEMVALTHKVGFEALPEKAQKKINEKYAGYSIIETLSWQNNDENAYFVSVKNDTQNVILRVSNGHVSLFKKTKVKA